MPRLPTILRRKPLLVAALLLALIKSIQFAMDSTALFFYDSGAFIVNALGVALLPERSYVYGWLIRLFALPFHSLRAIVAMQVISGGLTAWLLVYALIRFFGVRSWIAILAGLTFSLDPVQVLYERMVMTEASSLLATAIFLLAALQYLEGRSIRWLVIFGFLGAVLVSLRLVYLPVVAVSAVLLPLIAFSPASTRSHERWRSGLAMALLVGCVSMMVFQQGYRLLTGRVAHREAAYEFRSGFFLLSAAAPLVKPIDSNDARVVQAIREQSQSGTPLSDPALRPLQLWFPEGFVARLRSVFQGDERAADQAAAEVARHAIQRNPLGFLKLAVYTYFEYWRKLPNLRYTLPWEYGSQPTPVMLPHEVELVRSAFGVDVSGQHLLRTLSRRYLMRGRRWHVFLLASPVFGALAWWLFSRNRQGAALFFLWSCLLIASMCFGSVEAVYRYLHPFSFTGIAAAALLADQLVRYLGRESPAVFDTRPHSPPQI